MLNIKQNDEIDYINKEISLLEDRLKINEKNKHQFPNVLMQIKRWRLIQGQRTNLSKTKKIQSILKDILKNKIKNIKKGPSTKKCSCKCTKKKEIIWKGIKENSKNAESFTKWI